MKITRTILFLSSSICIVSSLIIAIFADSFNIHGPGIRIFIALALFFAILVIFLFLLIGLYFFVFKNTERNVINISAMLLGIISIAFSYLISVTTT